MLNKFILTSLLFALSGSLFAGTYMNQVRRIDDRTKAAFRIVKSSGVVRAQNQIQLPLTTGYLTGGTGAVVTFSSTPGLEQAAASQALVLDWADGEENAIAFTFMVPQDYDSGATVIFKALSESNVLVTTKASATIRVNAGTAVSAAATVNDGSFEEITIDLSAATIAAGNEVTISIVRNEATSGTGTLQIKAPAFRYNDSMTFE